MFMQILSSCVANVYNEFLIKKHQQKLDVWFQNFCMYFNGFILNTILLSYHHSNGAMAAITQNLGDFDHSHVLLIFNQAALGISASLLLKHLNSVVKAFSTAIEMMASAVMSYACARWLYLHDISSSKHDHLLRAYLVFGITVGRTSDWISYAIVICSIYLYALNPIENS